jgi:hypothetical protein
MLLGRHRWITFPAAASILGQQKYRGRRGKGHDSR